MKVKLQEMSTSSSATALPLELPGLIIPRLSNTAGFRTKLRAILSFGQSPQTKVLLVLFSAFTTKQTNARILCAFGISFQGFPSRLLVQFGSSTARGHSSLLSARWPPTIYQAGHESRTEAVINIHYRHVRRTRVEHTEQCRNAAKGSAVTNTRRHRNHRHAH